jgi:DMSO/TMAO reductase YedYZ molybdopterin-dependent catalytic subunit
MLAQVLPSAPKTSAQSAPVPAELQISGAVSTPLVLTVADLKKMP